MRHGLPFVRMLPGATYLSGIHCHGVELKVANPHTLIRNSLFTSINTPRLFSNPYDRFGVMAKSTIPGAAATFHPVRDEPEQP